MDNTPPTNSHKIRLRQKLLDARLKHSAGQRIHRDAQICACIVETVLQKNIIAIAGYQAVNGEPDISPALTELYDLGRKICLPVVDPDIPGVMGFGQWSPDSPLGKNRFGIDEPQNAETVAVPSLDIVFTPLLGFSPNGHRIGMGGGYYDRLFSGLNSADTPIRCGIAYSFQQAELNEPDAWDVPMHAIITEAGWFTFEG